MRNTDKTPAVTCWFEPFEAPDDHQYGGYWVFTCPACGGQHRHGSAGEDGSIEGLKGHRNSHCKVATEDGTEFFPDGYYLDYQKGSEHLPAHYHIPDQIPNNV